MAFILRLLDIVSFLADFGLEELVTGIRRPPFQPRPPQKVLSCSFWLILSSYLLNRLQNPLSKVHLFRQYSTSTAAPSKRKIAFLENQRLRLEICRARQRNNSAATCEQTSCLWTGALCATTKRGGLPSGFAAGMSRRRLDLKVGLQAIRLPFDFRPHRPSSNAAAPFQPSVLGKPRDTNRASPDTNINELNHMAHCSTVDLLLWHEISRFTW